jgi:hypothetical protein
MNTIGGFGFLFLSLSHTLCVFRNNGNAFRFDVLTTFIHFIIYLKSILNRCCDSFTTYNRVHTFIACILDIHRCGKETNKTVVGNTTEALLAQSDNKRVLFQIDVTAEITITST